MLPHHVIDAQELASCRQCCGLWAEGRRIQDPGPRGAPGERAPADGGKGGGGGGVLCTEPRRAEQRFPPVTRLRRGGARGGEASAHGARAQRLRVSAPNSTEAASSVGRTPETETLTSCSGCSDGRRDHVGNLLPESAFLLM